MWINYLLPFEVMYNVGMKECKNCGEEIPIKNPPSASNEFFCNKACEGIFRREEDPHRECKLKALKKEKKYSDMEHKYETLKRERKDI